jgi:hypothetical protein
MKSFALLHEKSVGIRKCRAARRKISAPHRNDPVATTQFKKFASPTSKRLLNIAKTLIPICFQTQRCGEQFGRPKCGFHPISNGISCWIDFRICCSDELDLRFSSHGVCSFVHIPSNSIETDFKQTKVLVNFESYNLVSNSDYLDQTPFSAKYHRTGQA